MSNSIILKEINQMNTKPLFQTILAAAVALALPAIALADGPRGNGFHGNARVQRNFQAQSSARVFHAQPSFRGHSGNYRGRTAYHDYHGGDRGHRYYGGGYYHRYGYYGHPYGGFGFYYGGPVYYNDYYDDAPAYYEGSTADDSDATARDVQAALRSRGYYHGALDGDIGPASRAAIRSYQASRDLPITGVIDERLLRSLGLA